MAMFRGMLRSLNRTIGEKYGRAFTPYPGAGPLDRELRLLISSFHLDTVVDVGAHTGGFGNRLRGLGYEGRIISFEPSEVYDGLVATAQHDPRWTHMRIGLGTTDGRAVLHRFTGDGQFSSLRTLTAHATVYEPDLSEIGTEAIEIRRLESVWPELNADPRSVLLKVDTQGHDLEVIEGAGTLLDKIPAILVEAAVQPLYSGAPRIEDVITQLRKRGFELTGAFPIHRYGNGSRVIEFDCSFVNAHRSMGAT